MRIKGTIIYEFNFNVTLQNGKTLYEVSKIEYYPDKKDIILEFDIAERIDIRSGNEVLIIESSYMPETADGQSINLAYCKGVVEHVIWRVPNIKTCMGCLVLNIQGNSLAVSV